MSERIHALAQVLLGKSSVEECTVEELKHLAKRFPYFAPAQFLLVQKLKSAGAAACDKQQQKAVLYYPDPLQFAYFISAEKFYTDSEPTAEDNRHTLPVQDETEEQPNAALLQKEEEAIIDRETPAMAAAPSPALPEEERQRHSESSAVTNAPGEENGKEISTQPQPLPIEEQRENSPVVAEITTEEKDSGQNHTKAEKTAPVQETGNGPNTTPPTAGSELLFEPFHTVDYFASQGIKITADDLPKDKLSKQLRSFTEWLRIMKRLPATDNGQAPPSTAEKSVEQLANHSVEGSDVLTEAMAEVWAKQGAAQKAIETYNKLSLLNPSKKAYFAAKIENLKGS